MKHTIQQRINSLHFKNRILVAKWNIANEVGDEDKYLEYTYYIAMNIRKIKWLKMLLKIQLFFKKLFKKCLQ